MRSPSLLFVALSLGCSLGASTIRDHDASSTADTARDLVTIDQPARDVTDAARIDAVTRDAPAPTDIPVDSDAPCSARCGGACVDTATDRNHCGACGHACCVGQVCAAGRCEYVCNPGSIACTADGEACGFCVDPNTDRAHCGRCDNACPMGRECVLGRCVVACGTCTFGRTCCGTACVNTTNDPNHCGACAQVCCVDNTCVGGECRPACADGTTACPATPMSCRGSVCIDLDSDPMNCGRCGNRCNSRQTCLAGNCRVG